MTIISHQPALQPLLIRGATCPFFAFLNVVGAGEALVEVHDAVLQMNILACLEEPIELEPELMQIYKTFDAEKHFIGTLKKQFKIRCILIGINISMRVEECTSVRPECVVESHPNFRSLLLPRCTTFLKRKFNSIYFCRLIDE